MMNDNIKFEIVSNSPQIVNFALCEKCIRPKRISACYYNSVKLDENETIIGLVKSVIYCNTSYSNVQAHNCSEKKAVCCLVNVCMCYIDDIYLCGNRRMSAIKMIYVQTNKNKLILLRSHNQYIIDLWYGGSGNQERDEVILPQISHDKKLRLVIKLITQQKDDYKDLTTINSSYVENFMRLSTILQNTDNLFAYYPQDDITKLKNKICTLESQNNDLNETLLIKSNELDFFSQQDAKLKEIFTELFKIKKIHIADHNIDAYKKYIVDNNLSDFDFERIIYKYLYDEEDDRAFDFALKYNYPCITIVDLINKFPWKIIDLYQINKKLPQKEYKLIFDKYYTILNGYNLSRITDICSICLENTKLLTLRCGHLLCPRDMCSVSKCPECKCSISKKYSLG